MPIHDSANATNGHHARPKVLVPEKLSPDGLALLRKKLDVEERKGLSAEDLLGIISDYDALIVRSETKVTAALLAAGKKLKVVARAGVGVDNVDVEAATKLGIIVVNSPSGNIGAAAEHTIALLLATARNVPQACASLEAGKWERSKLVGVEVKGKTLGVIGFGKVGITVARLAIGLGMHVQALDPYASPAVASSHNVSLVSSLPDLLAVSDFLTIHTPLIASTKGMISTKELQGMKKGARILNVARGGMIDEAALLDALNSGHLGGAGIDVWSTEPPEQDSAATKLIAHPKVVATPHLGASTVEAQENVSIDVCEQVLSILRGDLPRSAVNAPLILPEEYKKLQPFVRLVEKMGSLYTQHYSKPRAHHSSTSTPPHQDTRTTFDLIYEGSLATLTNTTPLFAALIKGLTSAITSHAGTAVNIVNADLIARDRGLVINEQHSRTPTTHTYSSLVTLIARPPHSSPSSPSTTTSPDQIITGYCSDAQIFISRLDRFATSFVPAGHLLICHNYDEPGKIGVVGGLLGREGVNINSMAVAPVSGAGAGAGGEGEEKRGEALMILGVDREVSEEVVGRLVREEGIWDVSVVGL
ncbi:MAG: phosphoglycerate dehydrogenase [Lasallia pustulata]|uniref:D-3-phosphoglycerate dehydrogenase n=1 Tax=Lasallia pustulata TaxID=136370 RepID=A0A5M8PWB8_9LECA|nr:MAG: phosphoglycerate dehydrogenase [Lasallia pustulata]